MDPEDYCEEECLGGKARIRLSEVNISNAWSIPCCSESSCYPSCKICSFSCCSDCPCNPNYKAEYAEEKAFVYFNS